MHEVSSAKQHMVLTAVGPDRPGLVKEISAVIYRAGANLEDSRMAVLAGEFALIVLFSGTSEALEQIQQNSQRLERDLGFSITFKLTHYRGGFEEHHSYQLEVIGEDQPGIVHEVSEVLADASINVKSLESRVHNAAFSGTPIFALQAELQIPTKDNLEEIQSKLEAVCEAKHLTYSLDPLERLSV